MGVSELVERIWRGISFSRHASFIFMTLTQHSKLRKVGFVDASITLCSIPAGHKTLPKLTQPKAPTLSKSTMSAQQRYSTLVKHICQIYSAKDDGVAELTTGLHDILTRVNPDNAADWKKVQADSKRLLRVWHACADEDDAAADEVVDQIAESLKEFVASEVQIIADKPTLEVTEVAVPVESSPIFKTVVVETGGDDSEEEEEEEEETAPLVVLKESAADIDDEEESVIEPADDEDLKILNEKTTMDIDDEEVEDADQDLVGTPMEIEEGTPDEAAELEEAIAEAEADAEEDAEVAAAVVEEAKEKEEADKEAEAADSNEEEEEADIEESGDEKEEEAEEEEEGLEVEKRVIRGRPYWVDVNTNKLYAVIGDDDVGDEVGAIINGKPVFRS